MPVTRFPIRETTLGRLAGFMAHLRRNGLALGVQDTGLAMAALAQVRAIDKPEVRFALKAICTSTADDFARFDALFAAYWFNAGREKAGKTGAGNDRQRSAQITEQDGLAGSGQAERPDTDGAGAAPQDGQGRLVGSCIRNLMHVDLRQVVDKADLARAEGVAADLARAIRDRRSRRRKAARRGERLDLRRIIRASLATGGDLARLYHRHRPDRSMQIVCLFDVSRPISVYARVFPSFLKGLMTADSQTDAYLFHTRLVRIIDASRDKHALRAVNRM